MGRRISVTANGQTETFVWDMLGRLTSASGALGTVAYQYDIAGRRTRLTWPDSFYVSYDHDLDGALTAICEQVSVCSPSSTALLAGFAYNNRGQRTALDYGNGLNVAYAYDASDRLSSLTHDLTGASDDQSFTFDYNPAGQIVSRAKTNTAYDYDALSNVTIDSVANALNQITCIGDTAPACTGGTSVTHDSRGNMTAIGADTYSYDIYNRMTAGGSATLSYDGAGRLYEADDGVDARRFLYDGANVIAEYDDTGTMLHRYVRGASGDEVLVEYDGSGTSSFDKTWLHHDERGSVIAGSNFLGAKQFINTYDEFGKPDAANEGSFQYTGQLYLAETETAGAGTGLYHYKARAYNPELGRFMQTDPIGYADGLNLYAYVSGDPVNSVDPSGLQSEDIIIVTGTPIDTGGRNAVFTGPTGTAGDTFQRDLDVLDEYEEYLEQCEKEKAPLDAAAVDAATKTNNARTLVQAARHLLPKILGPLAIHQVLSPGARKPPDIAFRGLSNVDLNNLSTRGAILPSATGAPTSMSDAIAFDFPSSFVTASRSFDIASSKSDSVAIIDLNRVPSPAFDVSDFQVANDLLDSSSPAPAIAFAEKIVLISGPVPATAIDDIVDTSCK